MLPVTQQIAAEFKEGLQKLYGAELAALILFGSHARGESNEESDIDFAIVLKKAETRRAQEIFKISDVSTKLGQKYGELISVFPISSARLKNSMLPIYQEIRKDGIKI